MSKILKTEEIVSIFGEADTQGSNLVYIDLPYPMRLAWDTDTVVNRTRCHKDAAHKFLAVFNDLLDNYTLPVIQKLGIDLFGGIFNYRPMRGGTSLSRHSWGIAIDLDPSRNKLRETKKTARFARPEYKIMIEIFYKHGFVSYGVEKDYDWMHFELTDKT